MKVTYVGGIDALDLHLPSGIVKTVKTGETIEVPDDFAAVMLEAVGVWEKAKAEKPKGGGS